MPCHFEIWPAVLVLLLAFTVAELGSLLSSQLRRPSEVNTGSQICQRRRAGNQLQVWASRTRLRTLHRDLPQRRAGSGWMSWRERPTITPSLPHWTSKSTWPFVLCDPNAAVWGTGWRSASTAWDWAPLEVQHLQTSELLRTWKSQTKDRLVLRCGKKGFWTLLNSKYCHPTFSLFCFFIETQ